MQTYLSSSSCEASAPQHDYCAGGVPEYANAGDDGPLGWLVNNACDGGIAADVAAVVAPLFHWDLKIARESKHV